MSTLRDRQTKKKSKNKSEGILFSKTDHSDWMSYLKYVLYAFIGVILLCFIGFGSLNAIKNIGHDEYLPTNIDKSPYNPDKTLPFSKTIPYMHIPNLNSELNYGQSISRIIAGIMSQIRGTMQLSYQFLSHLDIGKFKFLDEGLFIASPILLMFLTFFTPIIGALGGALTWWNMKADIFVSIFSFFIGMYVIFIMFNVTHLYPLLFTIFSVYQMYNSDKIKVYAKEMKHLIYLFVSLAIIVPGLFSLWYPYVIGLVGGALLPYLYSML